MSCKIVILIESKVFTACYSPYAALGDHSMVRVNLNQSKFFSIKVHTYSRLRNKHRATLINFWTFSRGYVLIRENNAYLFQNIHYLMVWEMPILRATFNIFAKCSRGYVYSRVLESLSMTPPP